MSHARPLIGLSTYREQARWGVWDQPADLLPADYSRAIERAGGVPVLLPPQEGAAAASLVSRMDALVLTGGSDLDPRRYGAEPHRQTAGWRPDRDEWEFALLAAAHDNGLAVLGICRGMQVMAVHGGGILDQHIPDEVAHPLHSPGGDQFGDIAVNVCADSRLRGLMGTQTTVTCHHHQAVREFPGFRAAAYAEDGTLEAMERPGERFVVGVQWHPETESGSPLFRELVRAASRQP